LKGSEVLEALCVGRTTTTRWMLVQELETIPLEAKKQKQSS
jgi:hypothetical protein